jgi:hypothetical protein
MSPDQPRPVRTRRTLRRRSRTPRRPQATESEAEASPLAHLRKRYVLAARITGISYLTVVALTTVAFPNALTLTQTIGLEFGVGFLGVMLMLVAIVLRVLTENTSLVLAVFKAASAASAANAALESELSGTAVTHAPPIPIQRGQEIRAHRGDRHAV